MSDGRNAIRVVKYGGSQLRQSLELHVLEAWLRRQPLATTVVVTGGGEWADAVRQIDARHGLSTASAHDLAVRAMSFSSYLAAVLQPNWPRVARWDELRGAIHSPIPATFWFDVAPFLRDEEPNCPGQRLPCGWAVTSDSIAARIAELLDADQLVLFKACPPPMRDLAQLAAHGFVDAWFPTAAQCLRQIVAVEAGAEGSTDWPIGISIARNGAPHTSD